MPKPHDYQTEAIVIKKAKHGEADRILTLFTADLGKVRVVAKGVRKSKSKLAGHLELLSHSAVSLTAGHNLDVITGSQNLDSFVRLLEDLDLSARALYVTELVDQFSADESENRPLFLLLLETLRRLCQPDDADVLLRFFELQLLHETGYRPQLRECVACHAIIGDDATSQWFSASAGGLLCGRCAPPDAIVQSISSNALKVLRFLQSATFEDLSRLKMGSALAGEVREVLRRYLRYLLERDVKSAAWMDELKAKGADGHPAL